MQCGSGTKFIYIPSICLFMFQGHGCKIPLTFSRKVDCRHRKCTQEDYFKRTFFLSRSLIFPWPLVHLNCWGFHIPTLKVIAALKMIWDTLTSSNLARMIVIQCLMVVMESGWQMAKIASPILVALLSAARFSSSFFMNSYSRNKDFNYLLALVENNLTIKS